MLLRLQRALRLRPTLASAQLRRGAATSTTNGSSSSGSSSNGSSGGLLQDQIRGSASSPLTAIRPGHELDTQKLISYLKDHGALDRGVSDYTIKQFANGQSNPTFVISTPDQRNVLVVRKQPPGKLLKGAHAVDREHQVMAALGRDAGGNAVPVPTMRGFCSDPTIVGTPFFYYDFVNGRFFKDPSLPDAQSPEERRRVYFSMIDTLARIHSADVKALQLSGFVAKTSRTDTHTEPYVLRQLAQWSKMYRATATEAIDDMDELMLRLPKLYPHCNDKSCGVLVHGDYRIDNLLFEPNEPNVLAVLDWELSTLGDNMADFAYFCMAYDFEPNNPFFRGLKGRDLASLGIPTKEEALQMYVRQMAAHSASTKAHLVAGELDYYSAFAFFRSCAILQGVYKRHLNGNASASNAHEALSMARECARLGVQSLRRYEDASAAPTGALLQAFNAQQQQKKQQQQQQHGVEAGRVMGHHPHQHQQHQVRYPPLAEAVVSQRAKDLLNEVHDFLVGRILPVEAEILRKSYEQPQSGPYSRWAPSAHMEALKAEARSRGLWNLFMPRENDAGGRYGAGLSNLEYAAMAEVMGRSLVASEVFNCSAPDTGNMEILARYGTEEQRRLYLAPLLDGSARSCFAMTEPDVASSDATNMEATIARDGDALVLNGHKWWVSGALDPRCAFVIFMGKSITTPVSSASTSPLPPPHRRHSMVIVPLRHTSGSGNTTRTISAGTASTTSAGASSTAINTSAGASSTSCGIITPGIDIIRPMRVFGFDDAPHGHAEMLFHGVRVPASRSLLLGEGAGFEIAQGRLGPGRIHHCMRLVGMAERSLEMMCERASTRVAFGKALAEQGSIQQLIGESRVQIDAVRMLCLSAAHKMDVGGNKAARGEIAIAKAAAPRMARDVIDRAMQVFGAKGVSQDTPLAHFFASARALQLADGPDEVHLAALAKTELRGRGRGKE